MSCVVMAVRTVCVPWGTPINCNYHLARKSVEQLTGAKNSIHKNTESTRGARSTMLQGSLAHPSLVNYDKRGDIADVITYAQNFSEAVHGMRSLTLQICRICYYWVHQSDNTVNTIVLHYRCTIHCTVL